MSGGEGGMGTIPGARGCSGDGWLMLLRFQV